MGSTNDDKPMVIQSTGSGANSDQYYPTSKKDDGITTPLLVLGGFAVLGYILNKHFIEESNMGNGRILNNFLHQVAKYEDLDQKRDFFQRQYRTHNVVYPDILYQGVRKQARPDNVYVNRPMPASDDTLLTYAEPSNIVTDNVLYEIGIPDIKEDYKITGVIPGATYSKARTAGGKRGFVRRRPADGGSNTVITTEYNPGISEKVREENPKVVTVSTTPAGRKSVKIARLAPIRPTTRRKFNSDYDVKGNPIQTNITYDTRDYLRDLKLTNEDYGEGEPGGKASSETIGVFEDFLTKGTLRAGYEIIMSDD